MTGSSRKSSKAPIYCKSDFMTQSERESSTNQPDQLLIRPEAEAWQIHTENYERADLFKIGLCVGTVIAVFGEAAAGVVVHPAVCGLVPFTIAAAVYVYRGIDETAHREWLKIWLRPHRTGVGSHGETEAMLAMKAKPINDPSSQLSGESRE